MLLIEQDKFPNNFDNNGEIKLGIYNFYCENYRLLFKKNIALCIQYNIICLWFMDMENAIQFVKTRYLTGLSQLSGTT